MPVLIYPPLRPSQLEDHLRRHAKILDNAQATCLITVPEGKAVARLLKANAERLHLVVSADDLMASTGTFAAAALHADQLALLQYTSGSTGQPKGVMLSHAQLLANIRAMGAVVHARPEDVFVSWLPLYHDMGLIGAWLGSLYYAMLAVLMPPVTFLARPCSWLETIHRHGGSISAAPNFAYEMCVNKIPDDELMDLDLSTWRLAFNGAEPVNAQTLRGFGNRFSRYGFNPLALAPVYGLAECGVGLAFPPPGRGARVDRIERDTFERTGNARPAGPGYEPVLEFVACGRPLPGYEIRIVDSAGQELGEREVGSLEFRGPSVTHGYCRNPQASARLFHGDWLDSGDLAYISSGDVYPTSGIKDVIIRAGRNIHPYQAEQAVGDLPGVRKGCVAVFGAADPQSQLERLIVVAESRETDPARLDEVRTSVKATALAVLGVSPDDVLVLPPHSVLKTSSGKIRRAACRELYQHHRLGKPARGTGWQAARVWLSGAVPQWRRARRAAGHTLYAAWVYAVFFVMAPVALVAAAVMPTLSLRWRAIGFVARSILNLAGVKLRVQGLHHLDATRTRVMVANHASYADGLVLLATLPEPVAFVAKAELQHHGLAGWFLGRLHSRFVERFDVTQGQADARRLSQEATQGPPLLVFPEGTFTRSPGLRPFHLGAFVAAVQSGQPVVPVTIRGTRSVLRGDGWFPHRGAVTVTIAAPLAPGGSDWSAALELRNATRAIILSELGEPDLGPAASAP